MAEHIGISTVALARFECAPRHCDYRNSKVERLRLDRDGLSRGVAASNALAGQPNIGSPGGRRRAGVSSALAWRLELHWGGLQAGRPQPITGCGRRFRLAVSVRMSLSRSTPGGVPRASFRRRSAFFRKTFVEGINLFETPPFLHGAPLSVGRKGGSATGRSHHR